MEENDQPAPRPFMNFGPGMRAILLLALYFSCVGIYTMLARSSSLAWLDAGPDSGYSLTYAMLGLAIGSVLFFAVPAIIYANVFPQERFAFFRLNKPVLPGALIFGALAMIVLIPGIDQVATWISQSITDPDLQSFEEAVQKQNDWFLQMPAFGDLMLCLLVNALIPAVCEELFFRAGIQQILMESARNIHIPIVSTALIFAFMHFNVSGGALIFLAGLMLGYAFYWTGSLRLTIVMHFFFNAISIIESYIAQHNSSFAKWEPGIPVVITSFAASAGFFYLTWKSSRKVIGNW
ncbi:MAG TPA: type II CAAX endopeptidase family protein [Bacteroidia bacterium]|nr:type II CAAX endopeptidase family protein [Bacteroidia bacterium]